MHRNESVLVDLEERVVKVPSRHPPLLELPDSFGTFIELGSVSLVWTGAGGGWRTALVGADCQGRGALLSL